MLATLSPLASYFSLQGQRKVTKRKALPFKSTAGIGVGSRGFSDSPSMARPKTARVLRAALRVLVHKEFQELSAAIAAMREKRASFTHVFALAVAAKNVHLAIWPDNPWGGAHGWAPFSVEPWMASLKMVDPFAWRVSPDRGSALSFGYFSLGACKEK